MPEARYVNVHEPLTIGSPSCGPAVAGIRAPSSIMALSPHPDSDREGTVGKGCCLAPELAESVGADFVLTVDI